MSLQEIQMDLNAPKDQYNKFGKYKYRSLEGILEAVKPWLRNFDYSLTISDKMIEIGGRVYVEATATLWDKNMKCIVSNTSCAREAESQKGMQDAQITGSTSSYARKYCVNGLFAIDDTKDADATNKHGKEDKTPAEKKSDKTVEDGDIIAQYVASFEKEDTAKKLDAWADKMTPHINKLEQSQQDEIWRQYNGWRGTKE